MLLGILTWVLLVIIGVSDAREHRIPNKTLMLLLVTVCLSTLIQTQQQSLWLVFLDKSEALGMGFVFGFVLYLLKVMAPGDVKLIAVLGFFLGTGGLASYLYYVSLTTVFVGLMYWLINRLQLALSNGSNGGYNSPSKVSLTNMVVSLQLTKQELKTNISTGNNLTYMPFAPILVMGLALNQYYI